MSDVAIDGDTWRPVISEESNRVLREQAIGEDEPGSILRDFSTLLAFVGEQGLKTTGKFFFLPQRQLDELNERMTRPVVHRLKRPQQRSFPHLHGMYMLLRSSGLAIGVGNPPSGRLVLNEEVLANWYDLNVTEKFFTLLESWLVQGSPEIIAERGGMTSGCFDALHWLYQKLRERRTNIADDRFRGGIVYGTMQMLSAALMELFGWLRLEYGDPKAGEGMKVTAIERLSFGDALLSVLIAFHFSGGWPMYHDDGPAEPGILQPAFQPFFPEWQQTLVLRRSSFREGIYTWRVSLDRAWRQIVAPADLTLDSLAMTILDAFDFDCDHLYCFEFRDNRGRKQRVACPYEEEAAAFTDEVNLGELPLAEGSAMKFIFDYGDRWQFTVKLEGVALPDSKSTRPRVTAKGGRPPEQYG